MESSILSWLGQYLIFLAKAITWIFLIVLGFLLIFAGARKGKEQKNKLVVKNLNNKYKEYTEIIQENTLLKEELKLFKKRKKVSETKNLAKRRKKIFVIDFKGDVKASAVNGLRELITAILQLSTPPDEVVVRLESGGGLVSPYGLAASQLLRLKTKSIPLIICIDKIAASGGYLMACVADRILAAPFAVVGSIGVVAQLPNFHRFLKKRDIDFEVVTAGKFKRTLTLFGENTEKGREKLREDLQEIHHLFKLFIEKNRPKLDLSQVATGAHWLGTDALTHHLVDEINTSDDYLQEAFAVADIYEIYFPLKKSFSEKLSSNFFQLISYFRG